MVMAMNSEYRGSASGVAAPKKKAATRKTVATPGTKVSQASSNLRKATGQLFGAVLMGARYDDKTGKRIPGKKK